jgi:hypothetical protein
MVTLGGDLKKKKKPPPGLFNVTSLSFRHEESFGGSADHHGVYNVASNQDFRLMMGSKQAQ